MVYESLISISEKYHRQMAEAWFEEVKKNGYLKTYNSLSDEQLLERGKILFENFLKWLETGADNSEIRNYFVNLGKERCLEGFPLSEVSYALYLEKKVLWNFIAFKDKTNGKLTPTDVVEFTSVISGYFDMGEFFIARGYSETVANNLIESGKFTEDELRKFLNGMLLKEAETKIPDNIYMETLDLSKFLTKD